MKKEAAGIAIVVVGLALGIAVGPAIRNRHRMTNLSSYFAAIRLPAFGCCTFQIGRRWAGRAARVLTRTARLARSRAIQRNPAFAKLPPPDKFGSVAETHSRAHSLGHE